MKLTYYQLKTDGYKYDIFHAILKVAANETFYDRCVKDKGKKSKQITKKTIR